MKRFLLIMLLAFSVVLTSGTASASRLDGCNDSGFFSKARFLTDICWTCFFPMKLLGVPLPLPSSRGVTRLPSHTASPVCICPGRTGYPSPGVTWGMWYPTHAIELTRQPFCSPILFGIKFTSGGAVGNAISGALLQGTPGQRESEGSQYRTSFYNFHWLSFPVADMMGVLTNALCSKKGVDMDFLYFTEFDPTWASEMLALYTHPEIKLFAKVYAHAVCAADAVAATVLRPMESAFWCAGAWGMFYPFAGSARRKNNPEVQMLAATKGLAAMHRRGLAKLSYKNFGVCADMFWFTLPKQQYQLQNMWPWPERSQAQWIGASSWRWGQWRNAPAVFEDRVVLQWTYQECCITFW